MKSYDSLVRVALASAILTALAPAAFAAGSEKDPTAPASSPMSSMGVAQTATSVQQPVSPEPQTKAAKQRSSQTQSLQTVVVTASATGVKKLDASYNIVTASRAEIQLTNPKSVANLLKISPGIWPESSGGQTGANIEIAGFPGGGDAPFFTVMVNGTPLYGMPSLSFMDSSSLVRLDDTISRVEIVQGGPGAIFGPGQMGATANFILRQGTAVPHGDIGITHGSEGGIRLDGFYGFEITDGWFASIGGFYTHNGGIRDPQFTANKGGQLTATLSHSFSNGDFMLWARTLNVKNQYITPIPMVQGKGTTFHGYPGFDPLTSTYYSRAIQHVDVPNPRGGLQHANLADGRGGNLRFFGGSYDASFGAWTVSDHFVFDNIQLPTNALFSGPNPKPLGYYLYGCNIDQPAGWCSADGIPVDSDTLGYPVSRNVSATLPNGTMVPLTQSVIHQGWWYIQKRLKNFDNDFRLSRELFSGNTLTAGLYFARYTDHDNWSLGNQMLMLNKPNTKPIQLTYKRGDQTVTVANRQGFVDFNHNFNILEAGVATNVALYLSDAWRIGPWLLQAGGRAENINVHQRTCNQSPVDLDRNPLTLYDNQTPVCNGTWDREHYKKTHPSFTLGVNYEITPDMSAYVRYNTGGHFDDFDNGIRGANGDFAPMQTIENMEAGFKYGSDKLFVNLDIYHRLFNGLKYQETGPNGQPLPGHISTYGSSTHGLDASVTWSPIPNLKLRLVGDYMKGHYSHHNACAPFTDLNGNAQCISFNGKPLQRQPKYQFRFMPSYTLPASWGNVIGYVRYQYVGQRFEDQSGLQPLGKFHTFAAGIVANVGMHWQLRVQGTNLTNQIGLTEGNSRVFGTNTGVGGVIMARPIRGREVHFQAKYLF